MKNVPSCTDEDRAALIAYLFDECDAAERTRVEAHLAVCERCALEAESIRSVRESLDAWTVPEPGLGLRVVSEREAGPSRWQRLLRPAWALAAAAGVVFGVALALGGAEVRYEDDALVLRVGRAAAVSTADTGRRAWEPEPWQPALVALENELRRDLTQVVVVDEPAAPSGSDRDALLRQVRRLISESESRQQRERALWLTEFAQELDMQRRADQQQLQQELGALEGYADYLVRVSR